MFILRRRWLWVVVTTVAVLGIAVGMQESGGVFDVLLYLPAANSLESTSFGLYTALEAVASADAPEGEMVIMVDLAARRLTLLINDEPFKQWPVAIGKPSTPSPVGEWKIVNKGVKGGGRGAFGPRWHGLNVPWGTYGIHGTNRPGSIGHAASAGCIRMHNSHVLEIYRLVKVGTPVIIFGRKVHPAFHRVLQRGTVGRDVVQLQLRLREYGFDPGPADARYGPATAESVKALQRFYGLEPTGAADLNVFYLLNLR